MHFSRRSFLGCAIIGSVAPLAPGTALAGPQSALIDGPWQRFGTIEGVEDGEWRSILAQHRRIRPDGVAGFDYAAVSLTELQLYLDRLAQTDPSTLTRDAAFAFWVNLYNAVTIDVVAKAYPVESIKEVMGGLFNTGPWGKKLIRIAGYDLSLDDIEHGILRPVFGDARVHYAVNCASIGCPDLKATPWTAATLETDLEAAARGYIAHPRGVTLQSNGLRLSKIYDWFTEDFGNSEAGILRHINNYADNALSAAIYRNPRIRGYAYDWDLNKT